MLKMATSVTFDAGTKINKNNSKVYLIVKGFAKWREGGPIATANWFLGDLLTFFESKGLIPKKEDKK